METAQKNLGACDGKGGKKKATEIGKAWKRSLVCASVCVSWWVHGWPVWWGVGQDPSNGPIEAPVRSGTLQAAARRCSGRGQAIEGNNHTKSRNGLRGSINDSSITLVISVSLSQANHFAILFGRFPVPYAFKTSPNATQAQAQWKMELETDEWVRLVEVGFVVCGNFVNAGMIRHLGVSV